MDRIITMPAPSVRLHAWYGSAGALLRELSRALNQGQTLLRADSGLPVGTHLVLVMAAECLSKPLEVQGTVTSWSIQRRRHEMTLRYDFDSGAQRAGLNEALAELRRLTRRPRRAARVPLTLATDAASLASGLEVTVIDASASGARLRIAGKTLPVVKEGSRLVLRHQGQGPGTRRPLRLELEARWVGPARRARGGSARIVGGRFTRVSDAMKKRLRALLRFDEVRPRVSLTAIEPPPAGRGVTPAPKPRRRRRHLKR
jgi:hypothetical protein